MEQGGHAPEEADREADPPEQIPFPDQPESRPHTFSHEVGINMFEIIDSVDMRSSTLDAVCTGVAYVQVCTSTSLSLRLVHVGHARQSRIQFNSFSSRTVW